MGDGWLNSAARLHYDRAVHILRSLLLVWVLAAVPACGQGRVPDVRYEPSTPAITEAMLKLAEVGKNDLVYDLGCGDGRIVIAAVRQFGARGVCIDIDPQRIREARENARKAGIRGDRLKFRNEDLFQADFRDATVVTLYLLPHLNLKLRPKLWRDLKPGTRIVSHSHDMGGWKPEKEVQVDGDMIYLWTVPAQPPVVEP